MSTASEWQQRTSLLLGIEGIERLLNAHVLIAGTGGVGAYAAEMLCRAGIGKLTLIDADAIQSSNINRQLPALHSTIGEMKAELLAERFKDINPEIGVNVMTLFLDESNIPSILTKLHPDFIVDAIDTIMPKCHLIAEAWKQRIKIVSSMGAGAKSDISKIQLADLWETYHCGLSKAVRNGLKRMGMRRNLPVVFSSEQANPQAILTVENERNKKSTTGTISYMPAVFGCHLAAYVIKELTREKGERE
ncbi:MAG: tRNA threonylcarbamoyladenosine dehydratase [Bacteroidaceae bacterium]|nr:tRNA threonylcarbamoyladenosine dehydratase [Bacteroidaceae bacterium]